MTFNDLKLRPELLKAVAKKGYSTPTPIQIKSIPSILEGRDVMGGAQTGTGKTAAFTLPLLHNLSNNQNAGIRKPRALIMCPTRELANQILQSIIDYGSFLSFEQAAIFGGVKIGPQINKLRRGVDIVAATPGRLLDHIHQRTIDLSRIEVLILDEADRMLDMGFIKDIKKILAVLPPKRQNMLFSATLTRDIKKLSKELLSNPALIEVSPQNSAAETVDQVLHPVEKLNKRHLLAHIIKEGNWYQVLVFTRTKYGAKKLSKQLNNTGITSAEIHGDRSQGARTRALSDFKAGKLQALVATDIAARGLDIAKLSHVVNFDLPNTAEDYIHRIGRTGRAGKEGRAVSLYCPDEKDKLRNIEKLLGHSLPTETVKSFSPPPPVKQQGNSHPPRKPGAVKKTQRKPYHSRFSSR